VGKKVEKSLEPLLATPLSDGELLLGKTLAAFIPVVASVLAGASIYMVLSDSVTQGKIGYLFFPNRDIAVILLALIPPVILLSVEVSVLLSFRVNDIRVAQQAGYVIFIPFIFIYIAFEIDIITYNTTNLGIISAIIWLQMRPCSI
jgi:ABC-type Na+ efflux pump permease subunit